jgi:methylmalonyl-CoA mutase cobalamin-binding subunit
MVFGQHHMVGFKVLRSFYANCGYSVQTSAECKTDRSAVLTVMSGLDPHMINKLKDE